MPSDRITNLLEPEHQNHDAPPAPPPIDSANHSHNPYGFITDPPSPAKKKLLPSGNSKKSQIIVIGAGIVGLIIVITLVLGLLGRAGAGVKDDYISLATQQADLIRISDIGLLKGKKVEARNLATTAKYILASEQPAILKSAKKAGAKTDAKALAVGRDTQVDKQLAAAAQANRFDEVFTQTMQTKLKKYQQTIKKVYDETTTKTTKDALGKDYADVGTLIVGQAESNPTQ